MVTQANEENLDLAKLRKQDPMIFRQLVDTYHRPMLYYAGSIAGEQNAEEVMQEAWISVYRALPSFEGRSMLKTWIYTIVSNAAKSYLRKENKSRLIASIAPNHTYLSDARFNAAGAWNSPPPVWDDSSPETLLENEELKDCIDKKIKGLPDLQQAVFILRDLEQLALEDICNILDISYSNVKVLLHRARINLMQTIDHYQETGEC